MTLVYLPFLHFYIGWEGCCCNRMLHFCCTTKCLKVFYRCFELVWDWSDISPSHGAQANYTNR